MKGFRLVSLHLLDEEFGGMSFDFADENKQSDKLPYTTLIIGPNGTGKTRLLKIIAEIFNELFLIKTKSQFAYKPQRNFLLTYKMGKDEFIFSHNRGDFRFLRNNKPLEIANLNMPDKAIVASYNIHERFPVKEGNLHSYQTRVSKFDNHFYEYLGLRTNRNMIFSSGYINRTVDLIIDALSDDTFKKNLNGVFKVLKFLPELEIIYRVRQKELFQGNPSQKNLFDFVETQDYKKIGFAYNKLRDLSTSSKDQQNLVFESIKQVRELMQDSQQLKFSISFDETSDNSRLLKAFESLSILRKIGLLSYDSISVYKKEMIGKNRYDIKQLSSGEIQILTSFLSLSSVVEDNSLILIDEPEISLHPNWQIQYVDLLNTIFKRYPTCHFLLASHSHFLASDLGPESSSILALSFNESLQLRSERLEYDTYGWSAENILYNVFGVSTSRNHYMESDVNNLLVLLSEKTEDFDQVERLVTRLGRFKLTQSDPLLLLISDAKKYLNKNGII